MATPRRSAASATPLSRAITTAPPTTRLTAPNYFGIQLDDTNAAATSWNPAVTGTVNGNADGGNGGVQAIYVDQSTHTLYMGGAFTMWNNQNLVDKSLIAFSFTPAAATAPGIPAPGTRDRWRHDGFRQLDGARMTAARRSPATPSPRLPVESRRPPPAPPA